MMEPGTFVHFGGRFTASGLASINCETEEILNVMGPLHSFLPVLAHAYVIETDTSDII